MEQAYKLRRIMQRLVLSEKRFEQYMGVSHGTMSNWLSGARQPNASALRLIEVLGTLEVIAPDIHASFIPARTQTQAERDKAAAKELYNRVVKPFENNA